MKVPIIFYLFFWFKKSLLALAFGFIVAIFIASPVGALIASQKVINPAFIMIFGILLFVVYQQTKIYLYYWGEDRGAFEYAYLENRCIELIKKETIPPPPWASNAFHAKLKSDKKVQFAVKMRDAMDALKYGNAKEAKEKLSSALSVWPENVVANFMLGQANEALGDASQAVDAYKASCSSPENQSPNLKKYIESQIERIKTVGPRKQLPNPGLSYFYW